MEVAAVFKASMGQHTFADSDRRIYPSVRTITMQRLLSPKFSFLKDPILDLNFAFLNVTP